MDIQLLYPAKGRVVTFKGEDIPNPMPMTLYTARTDDDRSYDLFEFARTAVAAALG